MEKKSGQVLYLSHGGGPLPLLGDSSHASMVKWLTKLPTLINKPEAIIVFSAHWEEDVVTIQSGLQPNLIYDYYGFPEASYHITYPCKGSPQLAQKIASLFASNGMQYRMDEQRPYDHGSYIPLTFMYPAADIPVIQVSLDHHLDPLTHLLIGKALRPLLKENILIIGSGFSFHNMTAFDFQGNNHPDPVNNAFQDNLINLCCGKQSEQEKFDTCINWEHLSGARYCHPREEHFLPLLVCLGLSLHPGTTVFDDYILGKRATGFLW